MNDDSMHLRTAGEQAGDVVLPDVSGGVRDPQPPVPTPIFLPAEPRLIGPFLRDLRKRMGVHQGDLVDAGVGNQGTLSALENAYKMPQFGTVTAYLAALGCSLGVVRNDREEIPLVGPKIPRYRQTKGVTPRGPQKRYPRRTTPLPEPIRPQNRPNSAGRCLNCFNVHDHGQVFCT